MLYTQNVGNVNELKCLLAFIELGYECSIPYGNGAKYDFIVDINGKLLRILCKASRPCDDSNSIIFNCYCSTLNTKGVKVSYYTPENVDYFATCFNETVYLIPVLKCQSKTKTLSLDNPNHRKKNSSYASDYELSKLFSKNVTIPKNSSMTIIKLEKDSCFCLYCGELVSYGKNCCPSCASKQQRVTERPDKETLLTLINTKSFSEIGRLYSVSDNAVRKWCKYYKLPYRKKDLK